MPAVTRKQYKGAAAQTTITNALGAGDTTITIAANTGWPSTPAVPFFVVISPGTSSEEKCLATISGTTLTLTRAQDDTSAQSHSSGATIYPVFAADDADEANKLASTLTTRGDLLTMGAGPDFARIGIGAADTVLKSDGTDVSYGTIVAANIASDAVTTAKILNANVTGAKLANAEINDQTDDYTLVVGDRNKRVIMNKSTANTVTVDDSIFSAGDTIFIANKGAGVSTITAGAGVTINVSGSLALAQYGGGTLVFLSASVCTFFPAGGLANPQTAEYLVIAGGGGGGNATASGGGGAGGYRSSVSGESSGGGSAAESPFAVASGVTYTITVGNGGAVATNGSNSSIAGSNIATITSVGGGRGPTTSPSGAGASGGSGGGGSSGFNSGAGSGGAGTANEGRAGGNGNNDGSTPAGGGGGGADTVGQTAPSNAGGNGGAGVASSITGTSVTRAGGGGGGGRVTSTATPAGAGGAGGGGRGHGSNHGSLPGTVNTGGGGGGAGQTTSGGAAIGGDAGGKGVVIIRQKLNEKFPTTLTGASVTPTATHLIFTFNDSGTIGWAA